MKQITKSNFRVVVSPRRLGDYGSIRVSDSFFGRDPKQIEKDYLSRCEEIVSQINRHVDEVGYVEIESDEQETCSFCGHEWSVSEDDKDPDWPKGTPFCCQRAIDEFNENKNKNPNQVS